MRIVDCFTDVILYARKFARGDIEVEVADEVKVELMSLITKSKETAERYGLDDEVYEQSKFPVIALIDELLLCSSWTGKSEWQKEPLQRTYFNTTSAGAQFYDRLNVLNKFGPDRDIREVYALCLGLGFRGKYFRGEDRQQYEDIKAFNLSLLLPDEAQTNIDSAVLFPFAYKGHNSNDKNGFNPRLNIYPYVFGVPAAVLLVLMLIYHLNIDSLLDQIQALIKY